jgi:hypothetical protein
MKVLCSDKNAKFLEEKPLVLFSKCSNFVDKVREIVADQRRDVP